MLPEFRVEEGFRVMFANVFTRGNQEAGSSASRIANDVFWRGRDHLDHELDNVSGRSELAVLTSGGNLTEHVFVEVALGVACPPSGRGRSCPPLWRVGPAWGW